jgi:NAD(P)-dependent dehydrogenase (short-subunit alcohol dehydrogenase family)
MDTPIVLITGALTGIGRATALAFAEERARIVVSGRHDEAGQKLVAELRALDAEAEFIRADVRHEDDVRNLVDQTVARFGQLDVAVNSAGTEGKPGPVTEQSAESYAATFDTNVLGTLLSMKHELRVMRAKKHGSIINVSSTFGQLGGAGASLYAASKHAVVGLTQSAALEAAEFGVRVNVVAPGPIDTGMLDRFTGTAEKKAGLVAGVPLKRAGRPEENCPDDRVSRIRQSILQHGCDFRRRRRQNGAIGCRASVHESRRDPGGHNGSRKYQSYFPDG